MSIRQVAICGLPYSKIFSPLSHKRHDFPKKSYWTQNVCFDILYISHSKNSARYDRKMASGRHVSTCYSCSILMKLQFSWQCFEKYSNCRHIRLQNRIVPCGQVRNPWSQQTWISSIYFWILEVMSTVNAIKASFTIVKSPTATRKDWARKAWFSLSMKRCKCATRSIRRQRYYYYVCYLWTFERKYSTTLPILWLVW